MIKTNIDARTDDAFSHQIKGCIADFWQTRREGKILAKDGLRLYWCAFTAPSHQQAIIIVNGRIEASVKYQEICFDLFSQGYDVYSLDHRGQGYSDRLVSGSDIGHVVNFDDYIEDLETFVDQIVTQKIYQQHILFAHSMGGAIATLYALKYPNRVNALILHAPMFGIHLSPWLQWIASPLSQTFAYFAHPANFALGQSPYQEQSFIHNRLTHSAARYAWFRDLYRQQPQLQVGGASNQWVYQSLKACAKIQQYAAQIKPPILLLQAQADQIVSNQAIFDFVQKRKRAQAEIEFHIIAKAKHELLFETAQIREQVIDLGFDFLARQAARN